MVYVGDHIQVKLLLLEIYLGMYTQSQLNSVWPSFVGRCNEYC